MSKTTYVDCPLCSGLLEVDLESGKVVGKWAPGEKEKSGSDKMASALKKLQEDKNRRNDLFSIKKVEIEGQKKKLADDFAKEVERVKKKGVEKPFRPQYLD